MRSVADAARASAQARSAFSIQAETLNTSFRLTTRIENCDPVIEAHKADTKGYLIENNGKPRELKLKFVE